MPVLDSTIPEHIRYRKPRRNRSPQPAILEPTDPRPPPVPCIIQSSRSKSTISSILLSTFSPNNDHSSSSSSAATPKKKNFTSSTFRGLGCTASSQVSVPAVIRTSADWDSNKVKKKKQRHGKKNKNPVFGSSSSSSLARDIVVDNPPSSLASSSSSSSLALSASCVAVPDVWCGPGIGFTTDAASVDCVVSTRRPNGVSGRGKVDGERMGQRERSSCPVRRMVTPEDFHFLDPETSSGTSRARVNMLGTRYHRHVRHGFPEGLAEIVMLQSNLLMGGRSDGLDRYRDLRLDVDNMTYEELLELGDRIGYVNTGLREDQIFRCLRKSKLLNLNDLSSKVAEMDRKCSICQEEYEADDETGKLDCGHFFHIQCIKQWLMQKNACPVCKTAAFSQS